MKRFAEFPAETARRIRYVLTDVDDTLTEGPRLPAVTYTAIERLRDAGIAVVAVTAAPAGWCDLICRMWPVAAVIGENGGLCFRHDAATGLTERRYWAADADRQAQFARLLALAAEIAASVPGAEIAHDQRYRETTLAFRNTGPALSQRIVTHLAAAGARVTLNSIWVLSWLGGFDKLEMARRAMGDLFALDLDRASGLCLYAGDSPNDEPMFGFFPHSVGVAGVRNYADRMAALPNWVTAGGGGAGFVEIADRLLAVR